MHLSLEHRLVGDATVVICRGRLTAGAESAALQQSLDALMPRTRHVVLHLGEVEFIDSGGLGLLVRYLVRAQRSTATLSVCAVSPKIDEVLRITKLKTVFPPYKPKRSRSGRFIGATQRMMPPQRRPFCALTPRVTSPRISANCSKPPAIASSLR